MNLQLEGKRALVTGSSSGLGKEIAELLAAEGASVVVHGRDEGRAEAVAKGIREAGGSASVTIGDLGTDVGADEAVAAALAAGPVDILVNNAGVYDPAADWWGTSSEQWADIHNINVISAVRMIRRLVPGMRERGWGRVIQISSVTGRLPQASQPHYAASNAARDNLAASLARELAHTGVTSNAVAAGGILVPATEEMLTALGREKGWGDTWEEIEPHAVGNLAPNDTGRIGRVGDYARLVTYLAGPGAGYINGTTLRVDGGWRDV
ncbi:SDR family NAD(P)-dependent oxidoreductase [Streptomyces sp. NBC_00059]|uniref:SDR family NAD(P)-dependent oxidoreductase n=1 Tax=Streptomyces sp. NBC_00059 TaxID=2975635 RepID=UPI0022564186|nr:SDR family NAD(P)-dependent oxidoreductase [Streptomyces sp. NBC_00059]MCX5414516.1 SDR family oxidoreductase [Streptomyces sp. NBC_00059]